ncbi:unnamed protein product, partial [marine sediment metagenome]
MKKRRQDVLYDEMIKLIENSDQEKFKELLLAYTLVMMLHDDAGVVDTMVDI